jgi:hypothetical protein
LSTTTRELDAILYKPMLNTVRLTNSIY